MNMPDELNAAIRYVEENMCGKIDLDELAKIACVSQDSFLRFFSYMTGMTLNEYIRKRRLTLAGSELQSGNVRVIDVALKYGYESVDAFARAFAKQHGILPAAAKKGGALKIYPPASFYIIIKGAKEMNFRMLELCETEVFGVSVAFDGSKFSSREELRHVMWSENCEDVPGKICEGQWNAQGRHDYDGVWYGVWRNGRYMVSREWMHVKNAELETLIIPAGKYAAFTSAKGGFAGDEIPKLWSLIFDSWLPGCGYAVGDDVIEVFHLWTDKGERKKRRYYEIWVPLIEK